MSALKIDMDYVRERLGMAAGSLTVVQNKFVSREVDVPGPGVAPEPYRKEPAMFLFNGELHCHPDVFRAILDAVNREREDKFARWALARHFGP